MDASIIHGLLTVIAPINGISIVDPENSNTWRIDFKDSATDAQRAAATKYLETYNPKSGENISLIKNECRRRILLVMSEENQRNTLAAGQAAMMQYGTDPADWPEDLRIRQQAAMTAWAEIERLRARSNEIEQLDPIPTDFTNDELWEPAP